MTETFVAERAAEPIGSERFLDTIAKSDELPSTDDVLARIRIVDLATSKLSGMQPGFAQTLSALREALPGGRVFFLGTTPNGPIFGLIISASGCRSRMRQVDPPPPADRCAIRVEHDATETIARLGDRCVCIRDGR